jgi:zinc protease
MSGPGPSGFSVPIQVIPFAGGSAWLVEDHSLPIVSISWSWAGGASLDPAGEEGAIAQAASLLTEGAGGLDSNAFADAVRDQAINLGFGAGRDQFEGSLRALTDALPDAVRLASLAMTRPRFEASAVERVRARALAAERRALETPRGQANRSFWAAAFPGHPAGRPTSGTAASLASLTVPQMQAALARQMRRDGLLVAVSGAIRPEALTALLAELFSGLPAGRPPAAPALPGFTRFGQQVVPVTAPQSTAMFGQEGLATTDPDWEAAQVMLRVLGGGGFSSRLMQAVREERGLAYGISAGLDLMFHRGTLIGAVSSENARMAETLAVTRAEWRRMAEAGPTEEELADAVAYLTGALPLQFVDSRRIADGLLTLRQNDRAPEWLAGRPARLAALKRNQLAAVAGRLLRADDLSVVIAGQPAGL